MEQTIHDVQSREALSHNFKFCSTWYNNKLNIHVFWDMTQCRLLNSYRCCGGVWECAATTSTLVSSRANLKMVTANSSVPSAPVITSTDIQQTNTVTDSDSHTSLLMYHKQLCTGRVWVLTAQMLYNSNHSASVALCFFNGTPKAHQPRPQIG